MGSLYIRNTCIYVTDTTSELSTTFFMQVLVADVDSSRTDPEGKWQCVFSYMRSVRLGLKRTFNEDVWVDMGAISESLSPQYVQTNTMAEYSCKGR